MTRMFLAVPSDPLVPEGHGVTYLPDGLMVDLTADMRCATCKWFNAGSASWVDQVYGYCEYADGDDWNDRPMYAGECSGSEEPFLAVRPDFGCVKWEARDE